MSIRLRAAIRLLAIVLPLTAGWACSQAPTDTTLADSKNTAAAKAAPSPATTPAPAPAETDPFSAAIAADAPPATDRFDVRLGIAPPPDYKPANKPRFTIATYNAQWLTDAYDNPYVQTENDDDTTKTTPARLAAFAEVVASLDADILVLEEVESVPFLLSLSEGALKDQGYKYVTGADSPTWIQNVVILSRFPLGVQYNYTNVHTPIEGMTDEDTGNPDAQSFTNNRLTAVDVLVDDDYTVTVFGVHFKASRGEKNEAWRLGQIAFLRGQMQRFLAERPNANIVLLGDFNMYADSREFRRLMAPVNGAPMLVDLAEDPMAAEWRTHPANERSVRIDFILPNTNMAREFVPGSLKVATPKSLDEMYAVSDHLPVVASFETTDR